MFESSKWNQIPRTDPIEPWPTINRSNQDATIETSHHNVFSELEGRPSISTLMSTAPVVSNLAELTQEVSAIREFAAQQQDRVRQLQEGYDWNIIKRFCLRVIHCIDNLETRINRMAESSADVGVLQDVRDELVFALESSGVEQFEPELESDYSGLEKRVEAVKTRIRAANPKLKGKIAEIVLPGYEYVLSEEEVRVVRCAQVKLYG
jgi:molecular chaperone GrpE (heat shock protein)